MMTEFPINHHYPFAPFEFDLIPRCTGEKLPKASGSSSGRTLWAFVLKCLLDPHVMQAGISVFFG